MKKSASMAIGLAVTAAIVVPFVGCGGKQQAAGIPDPVATVNGQPISSADFTKMAVQQAGQQILTSQIEDKIVLKWAEDEGVSPKDDQINKQIQTAKDNGMYDDQVKIFGEEGIKDRLKAVLARANLLKKIEKPSDTDLKQAYDMMKANYVHGPRKFVKLIINSDKAKVEEAAKKAAANEDFDKLALDYSGPNFTSNGAAIKVWDNSPGIPKEIADAAKQTSVNAVSKVITVAPPNQPCMFIVLKVVSEQPKADVSFENAKAEVEDMLAMQKSQYSSTFQEKLNEKKKSAEITINMPQFAGVAATFKNPPPPSPYGNMSMPTRVRPSAPAKPAKPAK